MKRALRVFAAFVLIIAVTVSCTSCKLRTALKVDDNFKGERYLVLDVDKKEAELLEDADGVTDVKSFETLLKSECPEGMEVQSVVRSTVTDGYTLTFVIKFNSFEDYKSKVSSVLGREPKIEYEKNEDLFYPGYTLNEDFSSADLLKWAADKLVEKKILETANISDIVNTAATVQMNSAVAETQDENKAKIDVRVINPQEIKHISVKTKFLGNNSVDRTISFCIPETTIKRLTVEKIDEYFKAIAPAGSECSWDMSVDERYYNIKFSALISDLGTKTASVLKIPVYAVKYTTDSQEQNGFTFSYDFEENLDFSSWPINKNRTCPVKLEYKTANGSSLSAADGWKLSGDASSLSYESASADKVAVKFKNAATYTPTDIAFKLTQLDARTFNRSMTVTFSETASDYGAQQLKGYLSSFASEGVKSEIGKNAAGYSQLTVSAEGALGELSEKFSELLGGENVMTASDKRYMIIKKRIGIEDSNSMVVMLRAAGFTGNISYEFVPKESSSVKDAVITDMEGDVIERLVPDKKTNVINYTSNRQEFKASFVVETYDLVVLAIVGGGILLIALLIVLTVLAAKKRKAKEPKPEEEIKEQQVKNTERRMVGAKVANNAAMHGTSNTIIVEPDYDDGLSRPDDESEGSWILVNTIRILAVAAVILFFLPFATLSVSKAIIDKDAWLTGFNMLLGGDISLDIFGLTGKIVYSGNIKSMILALIPTVIILIISIRKWIKPTIAYLFTAVLSVAQLVYLISVPSYVKSLVAAMRANNDVSAIEYEMGFAYTWSVIIYLVISAILLFVIFAEFGRLRRIANAEDEYEQQALPAQEAVPMLAPTAEESAEQDEAVNEIVENAIVEDESEPIAVPAPAESEAIVLPAPEEESAQATEEPVVLPQEAPVEVNEQVNGDSYSCDDEVQELEAEPEAEQTVAPKKVTAHVKPKEKEKVILPSQEEFDENSGY